MPTIKSISVLLRVIGVSSETGAPSFYPTCPMNRVGSPWQIAVAGLSIGVLLRVIGVSSETGAPSFYPTCPMNRVELLWQIAVAGLSIGEGNNACMR